MIGRDEEIRRVVQVLSRRTKNNPVLIGEPGVGKTAIAEGLARRIVEGDVPESLKDRQVMALPQRLTARGTPAAPAHHAAQRHERPRQLQAHGRGAQEPDRLAERLHRHVALLQ